VGALQIHVGRDGQMDMMKLTVTFCDYANTPKRREMHGFNNNKLEAHSSFPYLPYIFLKPANYKK
jgi:hypothetical protein